MLLGEPAPSPADLHFRLFGFPVRVHPYFWLVTLFLGMGGWSGGKADPTNTLVWVVVVFVSILVHELGHAFTQRYFGGTPWITLYSFGGLASCSDCDDRPRSQILIALAGPAAGFLMAVLLVAGLYGLGHVQGFEWSLMPVQFVPFDPEYYLANERLSARDALVYYMLYVNIVWGAVNLLPIYPLDGGRVSREVLTLRNTRQGIIRSLQLSLGTAGVMVVYGISQGDLFVAIMFGLLGYSNYQALQAYKGH